MADIKPTLTAAQVEARAVAEAQARMVEGHVLMMFVRLARWLAAHNGHDISMVLLRFVNDEAERIGLTMEPKGSA